MAARITIHQADIERGIRAARRQGALLIVEPHTGRMIFDPSTPRIDLSPESAEEAEEPNPWEEGLKDAAP